MLKIIDDFVWGVPLIVLILAVGIFLTIRLRGLQITKLPLAELVKSTSYAQAQALGLPGIGKLEPGFRADIVLLDAAWKVRKTFVDGEIRFEA